MVAMGLALLHIKKTGPVDKVPLSEKFIGDPYTGIVHGGIVTSFLDSLIDMRFVPIVCRLGRTATLCFRIDYLKTVAPCEDQCAKLIIVILFQHMLFGNPLLPGMHGGSRGALLESTTTISLIGAMDQSKPPRIINHSVVSETGTVTKYARLVADMRAMA